MPTQVIRQVSPANGSAQPAHSGPCLDQRDAPAVSCQRKRGTETGGTCAEDDDIVAHVQKRVRPRWACQRRWYHGTSRLRSWWEAPANVDAAAAFAPSDWDRSPIGGANAGLCSTVVALIALIIASAMVAVAGGLVARADWAVAPKGRSGGWERLWIVLPAAFLVLLIVLAARKVLA